jgi:hypothetical protein
VEKRWNRLVCAGPFAHVGQRESSAAARMQPQVSA